MARNSRREKIAITPRRSVALYVLLSKVIVSYILVVPRREKFEPPGTPLDRDTHPLLFAELDDIADSLNEPLPGEVYRIGQGNAFVADRGGILGFGSRRIIAVGLPPLPVLNISEFRGVVAHEFGQYDSGDTSIGPWVYKTQAAMIRTFINPKLEENTLRRVG